MNSSVSFVETVGRLYYNRGQHGNLAEKMVQHFLEWLRTHYFINTNHIDDRFRQQILVRSGLSENIVDSMIELIHEVQQGKKEWKEEDLYFLHRTIEQFRKNK